MGVMLRDSPPYFVSVCQITMAGALCCAESSSRGHSFWLGGSCLKQCFLASNHPTPCLKSHSQAVILFACYK